MITLPTISNDGKTIVKPKWDIQILKNKKLQPQSDNVIENVRQKIGRSFSSIILEEIDNLYPNTDSSYSTIAEFDTFISFNGSQDSQIVQNAVEKGSFRSVNKIKKPNICVIELGKGGVQYYIENMLNNLKKYQGSTDTFRIVTPYGNIDNLNFVKLDYGYSRENGAGLLIAKLQFQEIITGSVREDMYSLVKVNSPDKTNTNNTGNKATRSWEKYK